MPNNIVFSNPGASIIRWGDGVAAPYLTLSGIAPSTLVGAAVTGTVTNTGSAAGQWSVASAPADVLVSPSSGTLAVNAFASFTLTALAAGAKVITLSSSTPGATIVGSPASLTVTSPAPPPPPPPPPSPAPTGNITQFLTSDGGSAAYSGNFSGPTRDKWHNRLGFAWKRTNTLGNWLDASQVEEGSSAFGTSAAITAVDQVLVITANALVARWLSTGQNRGAYLRVNSGSAFPVAFYGRTDATDANRPKLTVITSTGTFVLTAEANAYWYNSSFSATGAASEWRLALSSAVAILRFDLSTVTGVVSGATLSVKVKSFPSGGSTGQVVGLYECDPPTIIAPEEPSSPVLGLADGYADFNALKASGDPALVFADDFEAGGWADGASAFTPPATRTLNPETNTTYARGQISGGGPAGVGTGSANVRKDVSVGINPNGTPDVVLSELYGQYWWYMESDFGTTADTAIKIPAMGVQFGWWNPVGYWQSTTGNGGYRGTGLKVYPAIDSSALSNDKIEYQGHSIRFLSGVEPTSVDDDPYRGWFGVSIYDYNLDQTGSFPTGAAFPMIAIRKERWYCFDIRVKQNTMTGAQDGLGNYATANADGIYQAWINGVPAYSKTDYRWRKHADFGVQGMWIDVYHGGQDPQPYDVHYRVDRVSLATSYIGPTSPVVTWPFTLPASGAIGTISTNVLTGVTDGANENFSLAKVLGAWGSAAVSLVFSGSTVTDIVYYIFGGGHADTANDAIYAWSASTGLFSRPLAPTASAVALMAGPSTNNTTDTIYGEDQTGRPDSQHAYNHLAGLNSNETQGPALIQAFGSGIGNSAIVSGQAHRFDKQSGTWSRMANAAPFASAEVALVIKDATRTKFLRFPSNNGSAYYTLDYSNPAATWQVLSQGGRISNWSFTYNAFGCHDPVRDLYIGGVMRGTGSNLCAISAAAPGGSWTELTFTANAALTSITTVSRPSGNGTHGVSLFHRAVDDTFVMIDNTTSPPTGIWVLTPPASSPLTNAWTWSRRAFTGTSMFTNATNDGEIYGRFQYVAALDAMIVCPSGTGQMEAWKL